MDLPTCESGCECGESGVLGDSEWRAKLCPLFELFGSGVDATAAYGGGSGRQSAIPVVWPSFS